MPIAPSTVRIICDCAPLVESAQAVKGDAVEAASKPLRIAQIAPLFESVPPRNYGGTERVVSFLTEELVARGHDVTLFASGDSITKAKLIAPCPNSLRTNEACRDPWAHHVVMLEMVFQDVSRFDVMHFHIDYQHYPLSRRHPCPCVTTLHGRQDIPDLVNLYRMFREAGLVSISDAQRQPMPWANWLGTVHHGLPEDLYQLQEKPGEYLAFLGRVSPEKGLTRAIEIARRSGLPLKAAAKIDKADYEYFKTEVEPELSKDIEFLGEIGGKAKEEFLQNAYALVFAIDWPEPFGLVMIEALACGTPVIAWRNGSVAEVIDNGVTGVIVETMDEAVAAVKEVSHLDRRQCRRVFEERFSVERMADDYETIYRRVISASSRDGERRTGVKMPALTR